MNVSIIIPAHNEEDNIAEIIAKIEGSLDIPYELLIVNDHSADGTAEAVEKLCGQYANIRLLENKSDKGFANAISTGLRNAAGEAVVPVMADLCDDLSTLRPMLDKINAGYDVIGGCRYIKGGARLGGSKVKGFFSCFVGWSLHYLLGLPIHDVANAFKMYRKNVIDRIDITSKGFEISMELALKAYYLGFKLTEVPTVWRERQRGKSSFKMLRLLPSYLRLYLWGITRRLGA